MMAFRRLRWLPFAALSLACLVAGYHPTVPRKPFAFILEVTPSALLFVAYKPLHYRAGASLFLLATLAVGARRPLLAFALTMPICLGVELMEGTAAFHYARMADMLSYAIGAGAGSLAIVAVRVVQHRRGSAK